VPVQKGDKSARIPKGVSGVAYTFATNEQKVEALTLRFDESGGGVTIVSKMNGEERTMECGAGEWKRGTMAVGPPATPAAASGAWTADDTFVAKVVLYETPFIATLTFKFTDGKLEYEAKRNVGFGPTTSPKLTGEKK
jgi:hypothetical protein